MTFNKLQIYQVYIIKFKKVDFCKHEIKHIIICVNMKQTYHTCTHMCVLLGLRVILIRPNSHPRLGLKLWLGLGLSS